jgi:hypothetical protein
MTVCMYAHSITNQAHTSRIHSHTFTHTISTESYKNIHTRTQKHTHKHTYTRIITSLMQNTHRVVETALIFTMEQLFAIHYLSTNNFFEG